MTLIRWCPESMRSGKARFNVYFDLPRIGEAGHGRITIRASELRGSKAFIVRHTVSKDGTGSIRYLVTHSSFQSAVLMAEMYLRDIDPSLEVFVNGRPDGFNL